MVARVETIGMRYVAVADLKPAPYNPRIMPAEEMEDLVRSMRVFGVVDPLIVRRVDLMVIGGHQRLEAAKRLGLSKVPVIELDLSDEEARALNIALNKIGGTWDVPKLAELLKGLPQDLAQLAGYDEEAMRRVAHEAQLAIDAARAELADDVIPEPPAEPITRLGDLWILGPHRLLCGDSTKAADVTRLMDGQRASLLATDPPYLVDYHGGNHPQSWHNDAEVKDKHWDDYTDPTSGVEFFDGYLRQGLAHCVPGVAIYQWFATKRHVIVEEAWTRNALLVHQELVWVKKRPVLTRCHFMWQYEPCLYGWVEGRPPTLRPPPNETTVWEVGQAGEQDGIHPTQKPVELFARPIRWHTLEGEICLEPFSGSGTQLVACERLGRRCYAMELAPAYTDVAVTRWEQLTGRKAERVTL